MYFATQGTQRYTDLDAYVFVRQAERLEARDHGGKELCLCANPLHSPDVHVPLVVFPTVRNNKEAMIIFNQPVMMCSLLYLLRPRVIRSYLQH